MDSPVSFRKLETVNDWNALQSFISVKNCLASVQILSYLKNMDAGFCVIEHTYLDQDFSKAYSHFYSTLFKSHTKLCERIHFFKETLQFPTVTKTPADVVDELKSASENGFYLGYIVKRPVEHAPISRALIPINKVAHNETVHPLVQTDYIVHFRGAELTVRGFPFTQQDSRVGACAQAAIWSASRHFHMRHRSSWYSTVDITKAATEVAEHTGAMQLPAGASFLNLNEMLRAIRAMDRKPMYYGFSAKGVQGMAPGLVCMDPVSIISRYVDSGIPVIVGLINIGGNTSVGHAVTIFGHTLATLPSNHEHKQYSSKAIFCKHFLANDDQRGVNLKVSVNSDIANADISDFNIKDNTAYLIAPLPDKVYMSAEEAEAVAWGMLLDYQSMNVANPADLTKELKRLLDKKELVSEQFRQKRILARTYLTYGWKYKARATTNSISTLLQDQIINKSLPKFIWVTEFSFFEDQNTSHLDKRRIFSHVVCDATSSVRMQPQLISHFPGLITVWTNTNPVQAIQFFDEKTGKYFPKIRGKI